MKHRKFKIILNTKQMDALTTALFEFCEDIETSKTKSGNKLWRDCMETLHTLRDQRDAQEAIPVPEFYVVGFSYGDVEKSRRVSFLKTYSEKKAMSRVRGLNRTLGAMRGRYMGNMHADQSHLDYEVEMFRSKEEFEAFIKNGWGIDWEKKQIWPEDK